MGGPFHPQGLHILLVLPDVALGNLLAGNPFLVGPVDDLVVHVRVIADVGHFIAPEAEKAVDDVKDHRRPGMADMAAVIDRDPADIHPHFSLSQRGEFFFLLGQGIVDFQGHGLHDTETDGILEFGRKIGILECWNIGSFSVHLVQRSLTLLLSSLPSFHYSSLPVLQGAAILQGLAQRHLVDVLQVPAHGHSRGRSASPARPGV